MCISVYTKHNLNIVQLLKFIKNFKGKILNYDLLDSKNGKTLVTKGTKVNQRIINDLKKKSLTNLSISEDSLLGFYLSSDIIDEKTGKIYFEAGYEIDEIFLQFLNDKKISVSDALTFQKK